MLCLGECYLPISPLHRGTAILQFDGRQKKRAGEEKGGRKKLSPGSLPISSHSAMPVTRVEKTSTPFRRGRMRHACLSDSPVSDRIHGYRKYLTWLNNGTHRSVTRVIDIAPVRCRACGCRTSLPDEFRVLVLSPSINCDLGFARGIDSSNRLRGTANICL